MEKTKQDYLEMQRKHYNKYTTEEEFKDKVVGNYNSHEKYPYEKFMLHIDDTPIFDDFSNKKALDFGCGMGRMVKRMKNFFGQVDGVDIGTNLIDYCKANIPNSNFWITNGDDCGDAFDNYYDFVYSTICLQHISSYDIRMNIFRSLASKLKEGGKYCFQMYSVKDVDSANLRCEIMSERYGGDFNYARWRENHFNAEKTNSGHDVIIFREDYDTVIKDMKSIFSSCNIIEDPKEFYTTIFIYGDK